jgi:hypothetical protein
MLRHKANQACLLLNPTKGLNGINIGPLISFIGLEALSKKMQMNYEVYTNQRKHDLNAPKPKQNMIRLNCMINSFSK